jgi:hypothetical protein
MKIDPKFLKMIEKRSLCSSLNTMMDNNSSTFLLLLRSVSVAAAAAAAATSRSGLRNAIERIYYVIICFLSHSLTQNPTQKREKGKE